MTFVADKVVASITMAEGGYNEIEGGNASYRDILKDKDEAVSLEQQIVLLTPRQDEPFFTTMKGLTVDGYYTSEAGLKQELGWHGNTFLTEFKGCDHPEHQR